MFNYFPIRDALTDLAQKHGEPNFGKKANLQLQLTVACQAVVSYGLSEATAEDDMKLSMSYAWEDAGMALRGLGDNLTTGAIMDWWEGIKHDMWPHCQQQLNRAVFEAEKTTPLTTPRMYFKQYRQKGVRTPYEGFDLPRAMPTWGPGLNSWRDNPWDITLDELSRILRGFDEQERMGLLTVPVFDKKYIRSDGSTFHSTVFLKDNPFMAEDSPEKSHLRLVD